MGFKSRQMPVVEVRRAMGGQDCLYFEGKQTKNPPASFPDNK